MVAGLLAYVLRLSEKHIKKVFHWLAALVGCEGIETLFN